MAKGSGSVTITGNDLVFNCVLSTNRDENTVKCNSLQLSATTSNTKSSTNKDIDSTQMVNRRKICTSSAYNRVGTSGDSSVTQDEMEHILCDSNDNEQMADTTNTTKKVKGEELRHP